MELSYSFTTPTPSSWRGALVSLGLALALLSGGCSDPAQDLQKEVEVKVQEAMNTFRTGDINASGQAWKEAMARYNSYTWNSKNDQPDNDHLNQKVSGRTLEEWRKEWEERMTATAVEHWDQLITAVEDGKTTPEEVDTLWIPLDRQNRLSELWTPFRKEFTAQDPQVGNEPDNTSLVEQDKAIASGAFHLNCVINDLTSEDEQIIDQFLCAATADALQSKLGNRDLITETTAADELFLGVINVTGKLTWTDYPQDNAPAYRIPNGVTLDTNAKKKGGALTWGGPSSVAVKIDLPSSLPSTMTSQSFQDLRNQHLERLANTLASKMNSLPKIP